jgi:hypothetical protein
MQCPCVFSYCRAGHIQNMTKFDWDFCVLHWRFCHVQIMIPLGSFSRADSCLTCLQGPCRPGATRQDTGRV